MVSGQQHTNNGLKRGRRALEAGFTIVELMIAMSVLSTLLVMATVIMIRISSMYTKGVNAANLQSTTRTISADISSTIQFSGTSPQACVPGPLSCDTSPPPLKNNPETFNGLSVHAFCIGTIRYSFVLQREQGTDSSKQTDTDTPHVLWRDKMKDSTHCQPLDLSVSNGAPGDPDSTSAGEGYDMMGDHMRLTRFNVSFDGTSNVYTMQVWTAFGDDDLVRQDDTPPGHAICSGDTGTQYCSTAQTSTQVTRRMVN